MTKRIKEIIAAWRAQNETSHVPYVIIPEGYAETSALLSQFQSMEARAKLHDFIRALPEPQQLDAFYPGEEERFVRQDIALKFFMESDLPIHDDIMRTDFHPETRSGLPSGTETAKTADNRSFFAEVRREAQLRLSEETSHVQMLDGQQKQQAGLASAYPRAK